MDPCRADIMEALPSKADPAVAGGPVSLPSQAAVLHGIRCDKTQHAADAATCRGLCFVNTVLCDLQSI